MKTKSGLIVSGLWVTKTELGWLGKIHDKPNKRILIAAWNSDGTYFKRDRPELDLVPIEKIGVN